MSTRYTSPSTQSSSKPSSTQSSSKPSSTHNSIHSSKSSSRKHSHKHKEDISTRSTQSDDYNDRQVSSKDSSYSASYRSIMDSTRPSHNSGRYSSRHSSTRSISSNHSRHPSTRSNLSTSSKASTTTTSSVSSKASTSTNRSTSSSDSKITTDTYRGIKYYKSQKEYKFTPEEIQLETTKPVEIILETYGKEKSIGTHRFRTYEYPDPDREWYIQGQHIGSLYMNYCRELKEQPDITKRVNIGELVPDVAPLVINLELSFEFLDHDEKEPQNTDIYDNRLLKDLVKYTQQLLDKNFNITDDRVFTCFVSDHKQPVKTKHTTPHTSTTSSSENVDIYTTYLSFHFPFARMTLSNQEKLIKSPLIRLLKQNNVRRYIHIEPEGEWKDWVKTLKDYKFYPMYGSIVHPDVKYPLETSVIYKKIEDDTHDFTYHEIDTEVFELDKHLHVSSGCIPYSYIEKILGLNEEGDDVDYEDLTYLNPLLYSMYYWNQQIFQKSSDSSSIRSDIRHIQKTIGGKLSSELDELNKYVNMIKSSKVFNVNHNEFLPVWRDIGALYHLYTNKEPYGLAMWLSFTQQYVKYKINIEDTNIMKDRNNKIFNLKYDVENDDVDFDGMSLYDADTKSEHKVESKGDIKDSDILEQSDTKSEYKEQTPKPEYETNFNPQPTYKFVLPNLEEFARKFYSNTVVNDYLSVKTAAWYAQKFNPNSYNQYFKSKMRDNVENILQTMTDTDIGICIYNYFKNILANTSKRSGWYRFEGHHWRHLGSDATVSNMISDNFVNFLHSMISENNTQIQSTNNASERDKLETQNANITKLIMNLKKTAYKSKILTELGGRLYDNDREFAKKLDSSIYTTGVKNGVIEVIQTDIFFRDGKPEDYITKYSNIPFIRTLDWTSPAVKNLLIYLRQVFPEKDLREVVKRFIASFFIGKNQEKKCFVFTGRGDNSKSIFIKLLSNMLGTEYAVEVPTTVLTEKKKNSSGPNPELARLNKTRLGIASEPGSEEKMDYGQIKNITGGDTIFARALNENGGSIQMTLKLVLQTNDIPMGKNTDKQGMNRLFIIPFKSRWSKEASSDIRKQFKENHYLVDPDFDKNMVELAYAAMWLGFNYWHVYSKYGLNKCKSVDDEIKAHWHETDPFIQFFDERITAVYKTNDEGKRVVDTSLHVSEKELIEAYNEYCFKNNVPRPTGVELKRNLVRIFNVKPTRGRFYGYQMKAEDADM